MYTIFLLIDIVCVAYGLSKSVDTTNVVCCC